MKVFNDQRVGQYPYKRLKPKRHFRPNNEIGAKPNQTWIDPSCPFSPFVANSGIPAKKQEKIKDELRSEAKSRLVLANYQRPLPLEDEFPEPEILCSRRRHSKVTRRNRARAYLVRNPTMDQPSICEDQPIVKETVMIL